MNRWKNYGLWVSIAALIPLLCQGFGWHLPSNYNELVNAILGALVLAGILNNPQTENLGFKDDPVSTTVKDITNEVK